jgi:hypothetical protein
MMARETSYSPSSGECESFLTNAVPNPVNTIGFLLSLHGPGWKERASANGPPQEQLVYVSRLRKLEARVNRIERHLKLERSH